MSVISDVLALTRSRIENIFMWTWVAAIATLIVGRGTPPLDLTGLAILTSACTTFAVYVYNDVVDADMDKLNPEHSQRPISSGRISKSSAILYAIFAAVIGILASYLINIQTFIINLFYLILYSIYSYPGIRLKKLIFIKELVVASGFIINSMIGGYAISGVLNVSALFAGILLGTFTFLGSPALQDAFDVKEDEIYGVKTMARMISWQRRIQMLGIGILLMITLTSLFYVNLGFSVILPVVVIASSVVLLRYVIPIYDSFERTKALRVRKITLIYVLLIQIALIISSTNLGFI